MDAQLISLMARIAACQANIEAMKADNQQREARGEAMAWGGDDFFNYARELEELSSEAIRISHG